MKEETKTNLVVIGILILFIGGVFAYVEWSYPEFTEGCLEERASNYCIEEDFEGLKYSSSYDGYFRCYSQIGTERQGFKNNIEKFYFTQEEIDECLIKKRHSFGKIK